MILPNLMSRDSEKPPNCTDLGSGACESDPVVFYIIAAIFVLIIAVTTFTWFGCSYTPLARKSGLARRRLTRGKLPRKYNLTPQAGVSTELGPADSSHTGILDPYHYMSSSFDDSLILNKSSSEGARVPEPAYPSFGAAPLSPVYVPLPFSQSPEKAYIPHHPG